VRIQQALAHEVDTGHWPGASLAILSADGCLRTFVAGAADIERGVRMTADTEFLAGSIGKTFVSAVAMDVASEGRWSLDDKLERWLGKRAWFGRLPNAHAITLRMLLNHSSGIPNHVASDHFREEAAKGVHRSADFAPSPEELVAFVLDLTPLFAAGAGYHYADTNYILLALSLEAATGQPLYQLVTDRLLTPLSLSQTHASNRRALSELATGYWEAADDYFELGGRRSIERGELRYNPAIEWAGGGFESTAADLARWMALLHRGRALKASYVDELYSNNLFSADDKGEHYALGVEIWTSKFGKMLGHTGSIPGYESLAAYVPELDLAVALLVNHGASLHAPAERILSQAVAALAVPTVDHRSYVPPMATIRPCP
jgi:D-alanyl-D-alanine carboxypeptidase